MAAKAAAKAATPTAKKATPASKKNTASKKWDKAATGPKSSPKAAANSPTKSAAYAPGQSEAMKKKRNAPIEDRTCKICSTVLSSPLKADHDRHQKTLKCQQAARDKGLASGGIDDPLSTTPGSNAAGETADELAQRTCQFCAKVLSKKKDLPGHWKTKTCVAKQYEREAKQENFMNTSGGGVSNTPIVMENAEQDDGYPAASNGVENGEQSPSNLPTSTTNDGDAGGGGYITKMEPASFGGSVTVQQDPLDQQASTTTNEQNGQVADWLGGPITTIADTLGGAMSAAGIDPLQDTDMEFSSNVPSSILDGLNSN